MSPHAIAVAQTVLYSIAALFTVATIIVKIIYARRTKRVDAALLKMAQDVDRIASQTLGALSSSVRTRVSKTQRGGI